MVSYGCKWSGVPHDLVPIGETSQTKVERCIICNQKFRWNKGHKGRDDNVQYLKIHNRSFAQKGGATNRLFMRLYEPEKCIIII